MSIWNITFIFEEIKYRDALSPLLFNFALEYAISKVQETNLGLNTNATHHVLAYAVDVNLIAGDIGPRKKRKCVVKYL